MFAVDPVGLGGIALRALPGPVRDQWLDQLRTVLPAGTPVRRIPLHVTDDRLLGGLDLSATLQSGRPVVDAGLLVEANEGVALLSMADGVTAATAARMTTVLDTQEVTLERDGIGQRTATRFGVIAIDEGMSVDEHPPAALLDRLAFHIDLNGIGVRQIDRVTHSAGDIASARSRLMSVHASQEVIDALCETALAFGIVSLRAPLLALRAARALAALAGRDEVGSDETEAAARFVFAPRATALPSPAKSDSENQNDQAEANDDGTSPSQEEKENEEDDAMPGSDAALSEVVMAAVKSALSPDTLSLLRNAPASQSRRSTHGRAGALQKSRLRGRPAGTLRGELRAGARLNLLETLRAAAPWQRVRARAERKSTLAAPRIQVRRDDFRITRFKQRTRTTTIFVIDASGSAALHRMAEAKGAVELLLADSYVRRDRVALIAFRGSSAELLLPPTRSLVRAKRSLSSLPGGGGTPLAAGIDAAATLADSLQRGGDTAIVVVLTDGRGNVARDGSSDRARASDDSTSAARRIRSSGFATLLIDTSSRPQSLAEKLATDMGARYLPLPHADAGTLSRAVRATTSAVNG